MPKRFIETTIMDKEWMWMLDSYEKSAWLYLICKCDAVGVYEINRLLEKAILGKPIDFPSLILKSNSNLETLNNNKIFIINYCTIQYGESIKNTESKSIPIKAHQKLLHKHELFDRVCIGLPKGTERVKDKDKEKDKDKVKEKDKLEKGKIKKFLPAGKLTDEEWNELKVQSTSARAER